MILLSSCSCAGEIFIALKLPLIKKTMEMDTLTSMGIIVNVDVGSAERTDELGPGDAAKPIVA